MSAVLRCAAVALVPVIAVLSSPLRPGAIAVPPRTITPGHAALSCGAGKDLVVQALEHMTATSSDSELVDADQLLKRSADLCSESGEAWYYRSLVETRLKHALQAAYALRQAQMFPSEAMTDGLNPFVLATPKGPAPLPQIHQKWALVIGIGNFADTSIHPLQYSTGDAAAFRDVLVDAKYGGFKPENVRLLTDAGATLRGVKESLNWLARSAAPDDLVVVYVASHGSSRELDTGGANYILTHDTEIGAKQDPDALYATALPMVELANAVATRLKSRRTAVFIDTCYSGGAAAAGGKLLAPGVATAAVSKGTLDHISQGTGRVIFAASRTDQESLESPDLQHGYFTYFLVEALREHPTMPLSQIFASVQQHVSSRVDADYKLYGMHQTPVMSRSSDDADFALGAGPGTAVASADRR